MMKNTLAALAGLLTTSALAVEYFADANFGNDTWDGTCATNVAGTLQGPKKTLQKAIDLADGTVPTVITVLPGVYDQGEFVSGDHHARIGLTVRNLTLRSACGKDVTHIVGQKAATETGIGSEALRCIYVGDRVSSFGVSQSTNVVIEGFTIRDGATRAGSGATGQGGGVYNPSYGELRGGAMLVDCVVSNCAAGIGGAMSRMAAYRTLFSDNYGLDGAVANFGQIACCILVGNRSPTGALRRLYNVFGCTLVANDCQAYTVGYDPSSHVYNCLSVGNSGGNGGKSTETDLRLVGGVAASPAFFNEVDAASSTNASPGQYVSTAFGDWRILTTAEAAGTVSAAPLKNFILPPGYAWTDFFGTAIDVNGTVHPGAIQSELVTPQFGRLDFSTDFLVDGFGLARAGTSVVPESWPVTYRLCPVFSDGSPCYSVVTDDKRISFMRPQYDGWVRFVPPRTVGDACGLTGQPATGIVYADATNGNDDWDGSSATFVSETKGPKKTLQAAADAAADYAIVRVAPGVYAEGGAGSLCDDKVTVVSNRVLVSGRSVGFLATAGAGTVTVVGAPDPVTGSLGPGALRCFSLGSSSFVQGCVLTGGYTHDGTKWQQKGAALSAGTEPLLADCVVSNNHARIDTMFYGRAIRSRFFDNHSQSATVCSYAVLESCVLADNDTGDETGATAVVGSGELYGCTVDGNGSYAVGKYVPVYGNVFVRSSESYHPSYTFGNYGGSYAYLAAPDARDYRPGVWSKAVGYIAAEDYGRSNLCHHVVSDVDGNALFWKDGKLTAGAVHTFAPMYAVSAVGGGVAVSGGSVGMNVVSEATDVTVYATDAATRPFVGFTVNGESRSETGTNLVISLSGPETSADVCAVYGTNWYVNAASGDDANSGGTTATAKKTIRAAATLAQSGDVIHVASGVYGPSDGTMLHTKKSDEGSDPITIASRVVVPEGVGLVADEGPERTFVVGSAATDGNDYGLGADAVRCLTIGKNAWVKGFTLTGGHTAAGTTANDDNDAGAALGFSSSSSLVIGCVISNNVAARSGAGFKCQFVNCRIVGNTATYRSSVGRESQFIQCFIDDNRGLNVTEYPYLVDSCTYGSGNVSLDDSKIYQVVQSAATLGTGARNTLFAGEYLTTGISNCFNCVFRKGCGVREDLATDCIFTDAAAIVLDASGRPVVGQCVGIDCGDGTLSDVRTQDLDLSGFQRVMNGARDIGALEADWRSTYGRALGARVTVSSASSEVFKADSGFVRLPSGALVCTLTADGDYAVSVSVAGSGTLNVSVADGEPTAYAAGDHALTLRGVAAGTLLRFEYVPGADDVGYAEVRRISRRSGFMLVFR